MPDLDQRFRSLDQIHAPDLHSRIASRASGPAPEVPGASTGSRVAAAIVALVVFALAVGLGVRALRDEPVDEPTPIPDVWANLPEGFTRLPDPPLGGQGIVRVWGGGRLFLWGGQDGDGEPHRDDGAVFDVDRDAWEQIADAPLSPRSDAAGVWTGTEFIVWGGRTGEDWPPHELGDGAAYDPVDDSWREIAPAPIDPNIPLVSVWTGSEMIVWGDWQGDAEGTGAAYDPSSDSWRVLPEVGARFTDASAVWTGTEMVVFGARLGPGNHPETPATGVAYDPAADAWRALPDSDLIPNSTELAWDGSRLVAMDYGLRVQTLDDAAGRWVDLPRLPANACEGGLSQPGVQDGTIVITNCGELLALEPGAARWRVLLGKGEAGPAIDYAPVDAADGAFLIMGWLPDGGSSLWALRLPSSTPRRGAWDVAAAFAAIRSHQPYEPDDIEPWILDQMDSLITPDVAADFADPGSGLTALWSYYWGFEVREVMAGDGGTFTAIVRFERGDQVTERLTIGPGVGLDGIQHDLVILEVDPAGPYVIEEDGRRIGVLRRGESASFGAGEVDAIRCAGETVDVQPPGGSISSDSAWLHSLTEANGEIDASCTGP